ncbi:hypothetical protein [Bacillus sp. MRMR6]|uniref:hypothetical protein n=1 Tax=Bacillus sp. MRMR6 TaxID=1928617 RepID=UPI00095306F3|nr:hypothetical protein [Bacillus sp. MRMR6]OLS41929.1 hypothetical protein BTR25_00750 [Bacillus sp. MRMR6]
MNLFVNALSIVVVGILAVSLVYTLSVVKRKKTVEGEIDSAIEKPIQKHIYLKNPIFLAYVIFFIMVLLIIVFVAANFL